jgi:protein-S-isoprenylcysteine O-methyltransferase Ste14
MNTKLLIQSLLKFSLGIIILGLLIFLPAWSLHYWQGWLLMGILFIPMFIAGLVMMVKRIRNEETVLEQRLEGYSEYKQRVKYKVIPYIW